jgi:hypothetical protein
MNLKRAILVSALLWVLIFFEVSILMFGFGFQGTEIVYYVIHYILLAVLITLSTLIYFKGKKVKSNAKEGFILGIIFVVVGAILDAAITVPLFIKNYASFFLNWDLIAGLVLTLGLTALIGKLKK